MKITRLIKLVPVLLLLGVSAPSMAEGPAIFQHSDAYVFGTDKVRKGAATLLRHYGGVQLRFNMAGMRKNRTYTLWYIVFNNPGACMDGNGDAACGEGDVGAEGTAVRLAGSFITGKSGVGNTTGDLYMGPVPYGQAGFGQLMDPYGAEIHIVAVAHGMPKKGIVGEQISYPDGGCNPTCSDQYAVVFLPPVMP